MNNKFLVGLVVILSALVIFETAYLFGRQQGKKVNTIEKKICLLPPKSLDYDFNRGFGDLREWDPFKEMEEMQQRMHRVFDDSFSKGILDKTVSREKAAFEPNISINQKDDAYIIKADLPGMEKNAIGIEINGRELILAGERKENDAKNDARGFYRQELSYGSFSRSIQLPEDAAVGEIVSEYTNGVLTITIPRAKTTKATPPKIKVPVK